MEVYLNAPDVLDELRAGLPDGLAVFALHRKLDDSRFYRLINDHQGLVREFDGLAHLSGGDTAFRQLEGLDFAEVVAFLEAARGG